LSASQGATRKLLKDKIVVAINWKNIKRQKAIWQILHGLVDKLDYSFWTYLSFLDLLCDYSGDFLFVDYLGDFADFTTYLLGDFIFSWDCTLKVYFGDCSFLIDCDFFVLFGISCIHPTYLPIFSIFGLSYLIYFERTALGGLFTKDFGCSDSSGVR
jgi:hypothetical protein